MLNYHEVWQCRKCAAWGKYPKCKCGCILTVKWFLNEFDFANISKG